MTGAVICDEHLLFAEAFADALRRRGLDALATADVEEALAVVLTDPVTHMVVGVDPAGDSQEGTVRRVRSSRPETWLVCVGVQDAAVARSYRLAGADLVVSRNRPLRELVDLVLTSPDPAGRAGSSGSAREIGGLRPGLGAQPLAAHFLTNRERDVLRLLVVGASTRQISDTLGIAPTTARGYVQGAFTKLGVHSRVEAVRYAMSYSVVQRSMRSR